MRAMLLLIALLATAFGAGAAGSPFKGPNCQLATPPDRSGEGIAQGLTVKVFPRRAQIDAKYNGCQTSWAEQRGHWVMMGVTSFRKGEAVAFWTPPPEAVLCKYKDGQAVDAKPGTCPAHHSLAVPSMAPGCVQKILGRAGTEGCKYE